MCMYVYVASSQSKGLTEQSKRLSELTGLLAYNSGESQALQLSWF